MPRINVIEIVRQHLKDKKCDGLSTYPDECDESTYMCPEDIPEQCSCSVYSNDFMTKEVYPPHNKSLVYRQYCGHIDCRPYRN